MKKHTLTSLIAVALLATGCQKDNETTKIECSGVKYTEARVTNLDHRDAYSEETFIMNGKSAIPISTDYPEKNDISFRGDISISVDDRTTYRKFKKGDLAKVAYRVVYESTFKDLDKDGIPERTGKYFKKYHFINAEKIEVER